MDFLLAKVATYNLIDLPGLIEVYLKGIDISHWGQSSVNILIFVFFLGFIAAILVLSCKSFIYRILRRNDDIYGNNLNETLPEVLSHLHEWFRSHRLTSSEMSRIWLCCFNKVLEKKTDNGLLILHSILDGPHFTLIPVTSESTYHRFYGIMHLEGKISIRHLKVACELKHLNLSELFTITISNFHSILQANIKHKGRSLIDFTLCMPFDCCSTINIDQSLIDMPTLKDLLCSAFNEAKLYWKDGSFINSDDSIQRSLERIVAGPPDGSDSSVKAPLEEQFWSMHDVSRASASMDTCIRRNMDTTEALIDSHRSLELLPRKLTPVVSGSTFLLMEDDLKRTQTSTNATEPDSDSLSKPANQPDSTSEPQVVLAYNSRIRQSVAASQFPRRVQTQLVRSASYYGDLTHCEQGDEEGSVTLSKQMECVVGTMSPMHPLSPPSIAKSEHSESPTSTISVSKPSKLSTEHIEKSNVDHTVSLEQMEQIHPPSVSSNRSISHRRSQPNVHPSVQQIERPTFNSPPCCLKLLIKVVKAEALFLKNTSNAYCVVELDEPYQRHTTHCSSADQLLWDQHLLFDLNSNSKRIAFEVFELYKRKKSVSKGRAELLLSTLFVGSSGQRSDTDSPITGALDVSEVRRRIPLLDRTGSTESSSMAIAATSNLLSNVASMGTAGPIPTSFVLVDSDRLPDQNPTIIAEFHFMEKAIDDLQSTHQRMRLNRLRLSRGIAYSTSTGSSANESPILGSVILGGTLSHSASLEFSTSKNTFQRHINVSAEVDVPTANLYPTAVPTFSKMSIESSEQLNQSITERSPKSSFGYAVEPSLQYFLQNARLSSPTPTRRALLETIDPESSIDWTSTPPTPSTPVSLSSTRRKTIGVICKEGNAEPEPATADSESSDLIIPKILTGDNYVDSVSSPTANVTNRASTCESEEVHASEVSKETLNRSDSLIKRSNLLGASGADGEQLPVLLPFPTPDFDVSPVNSTICESNNFRNQSLAGKLKPLRRRRSGRLRSLKKSSDDTSILNSGGSLALLGPSRHLAGVAASLSTLATDPATSPMSAAELASAVAVAGATGSWQNSRSSSLSAERHRRKSDQVDSVAENVTTKPKNSQQVDTVASSSSTRHDVSLRYAPPAASVATSSPGTFTALRHQSQLPYQQRRSDTFNLGVFRMFRHKKKRFQSAGPEQLLDLGNSDFDDYDSMSIEGFRRIAQDTDLSTQLHRPS